MVQHTIENQQINIEKEMETENSVQKLQETDRQKFKKEYQSEII